MSEIPLRAIAQIGKISKELEKAKPNKGHGVVTTDQTKEATLAEAGLSVRAVNRYEQLAARKSSSHPRSRQLAASSWLLKAFAAGSACLDTQHS